MALITEQAQLRLQIEAGDSINKIAVLQNEMQDLLEVNKQLNEELKKVSKSILSQSDEYKKLNKEVANIKKVYGSTSEQYKAAKVKLDDLSKSILNNNTNYTNINKKILENGNATSKLSEKIGVLRKSQSDILQTTKQLIGEHRELQSVLANTTFASEEYIKAAKRMAEIEKELAYREQNSGRKNGIGSIINTSGTLGDLSKIALKVFAIIQAFGFLKDLFEKIWDVGTKRERLDNILLTTLNNNKKSLKEAKGIIKDFVDSTGSDIENVTMAFKRMSDIGVIPTKDDLMSLSDMAISSNKTVSDYVEAIADSQQNENERLKEFGINAQVNGNKVIYTYKGIRTEVDNNALSISKYLVSLGKYDGVAGATAKMAETAQGAWIRFKNTLNDTYELVYKKLEPIISGFLAKMNVAMTGVLEIIKQTGISAQQSFEMQKTKVQDLQSSMVPLIERYEMLKSKTKLTKDEQTELHDIMQKIKTTIPETRAVYDSQGRIMAINSGIAKDYIKKQKEILQYTNKNAIEQANKDITNLEKQIKVYEDRINRAKKYGNKELEVSISGYQPKWVDATKNINLYNDKIGQLRKSLHDAQTAQKALTSKLEIPINTPKVDNTLSELEKERKKREKQLEEMANNSKADEEAKKLEAARKRRIELEAKTLQEIDKLNAEAIADEKKREEEVLRTASQNRIKDKEYELKEAQFSTQKQEELLSKFKKAEAAKLNREIDDLNEKYRQEKLKKEEESAKKILELTDKIYEEHQQAKLKRAEQNGDDFEAFMIKDSLLDFQLKKELRNKDLTEKEKALIEESYRLKADQNWDEYMEKRKVKTLANTKTTLENDIEQNKDNIFKLHDAKIAMLNFEYASEIQNADKIGADKAEIHRKYALKRKQIESELWQNIANIALSAYAIISDGLAQSRNLENQAEAINAENTKNRKVNKLKEQYEANLISKKQYDSAVEKADQDFEKKQKVIKRKQAEAEHNANVIKATQQAIQSILTTMSSVPYPFNIPLAAIQTGIAFDQVTKLANMPIPEFFDGGDTGNGSPQNRVNDGKGGFLSILHPNEYVVPQSIRKMSWWQPIERVIEARRINAYYDGGIATSAYQSTPSIPSSIPDSNITNNDNLLKLIEHNTATMALLNQTISNGILAKSLFTSRDADEIQKLITNNTKTKEQALS